MSKKITIHWFRRDLRIDDNASLYEALKLSTTVLPLFIFDENILHEIDDKTDPRVSFIYQSVTKLYEYLREIGSGMLIRYGKPIDVFRTLVDEFEIDSVYANSDYEPYAIYRDNGVKEFLAGHQIQFHQFKDHVIFEKNEIAKNDGTPYTVFTPYSNKWREKLTTFFPESFPVKKYMKNIFKGQVDEMIGIEAIGFEKSKMQIPSAVIDRDIIKHYDETRNFPAEETTRLGLHLRFGTKSIREVMRSAIETNSVFATELIWREFFQMIIWHFPHVVTQSFRPQFDRVNWRNNDHEFQAWCEGKTGYPLVDAGMRELNQTGFMHNRVRMVTASFLTKHLLIDWRWGEAYFAKKLLDYELASNNGNWQWVAGSGVDAAPYFRIFNPDEQQKKFDPEFKYIRKWLPEFESSDYPARIVEHSFARQRALQVLGSVRN